MTLSETIGERKSRAICGRTRASGTSQCRDQAISYRAESRLAESDCYVRHVERGRRWRFGRVNLGWMKLPRVCDVSLSVACLFLIPAKIASAQSGDRILAFHAKVTVARDRTLSVNERFEIVNDAGSFDGGFHRRLWVKAAGPQRAKAGGVSVHKRKS
jgi:hypothetical protein